MSEAARSIDYEKYKYSSGYSRGYSSGSKYGSNYNYGTAAPARQASPRADHSGSQVAPDQDAYQDAYPHTYPHTGDTARPGERVREKEYAIAAPGVSLFAVFGSLFVASLMVFVVLAQISYKETASETIRLTAQLTGLVEQQRILEISFESVIDMKEVERYARDVLGMSKPDYDQIAVIISAQRDRAEVIRSEEVGILRGFGSFISSLFEYFR